MDATEARKANLKALIRQHGTIEELSDKTGSAPRHVSQMNNGTRGMGARVARRFEAKLGLPHGWMDTLKHAAPQGSLHAEKLLDDFSELPPSLQEHVSRIASELRALIDAVPEKLRPLISAPPKDPERYREWEQGIKQIVSAGKRKAS